MSYIVEKERHNWIVMIMTNCEADASKNKISCKNNKFISNKKTLSFVTFLHNKILEIIMLVEQMLIYPYNTMFYITSTFQNIYQTSKLFC